MDGLISGGVVPVITGMWSEGEAAGAVPARCKLDCWARPSRTITASQGWLFDQVYTPDVARLAVECGLWPLKEAINGEVVHTYMPKLQTVEDYLKLQGRFQHLFEPAVQTEAIAHIQEGVNVYWEQVKKAEKAV